MSRVEVRGASTAKSHRPAGSLTSSRLASTVNGWVLKAARWRGSRRCRAARPRPPAAARPRRPAGPGACGCCCASALHSAASHCSAVRSKSALPSASPRASRPGAGGGEEGVEALGKGPVGGPLRIAAAEHRVAQAAGAPVARRIAGGIQHGFEAARVVGRAAVVGGRHDHRQPLRGQLAERVVEVVQRGLVAGRQRARWTCSASSRAVPRLEAHSTASVSPPAATTGRAAAP